MTFKIERVALIGLGLIASSIAHALRRLVDCPEIVGFARTQETRDRARELGFCDEVADEIMATVKAADLVIICTPVGVIDTVVQSIAAHLKDGAIVTDVGSVKASVAKSFDAQLPQTVHAIPGHPLAGTENSGPDSGFASLFDNRWCILTPSPQNNPKAVDALVEFWKSLGSKVEVMDAEHHDRVLAVTSHVPHLIAYTMVGVADNLSKVTESEVIEYSAAGFRDFTRIAASDPTMWRDVFLANKDATFEILDRFTSELEMLKSAISNNDGQVLHDYFTHTRKIRREILEVGQDVNLPDFGRVQIDKKRK